MSNYTVRFDELEHVREELSLARKALTTERIEHARTSGALAEMHRQLAAALAQVESARLEAVAARQSLGDLQDAVDELTTCKSLGEVRARISILTGEHDAAEGELSQRQELGRTEGRTL